MKQLVLTRRCAVLGTLCALVLSCSVPASAFLFRDGDGPAAGEASVAAFAKNGRPGSSIPFSAADFRVESEGGTALDALVISSLPDAGTGALVLGGIPLSVGDTVAMSAVDGLAFRVAGQPAADSAAFTFAPVFSNGTSGREVQVNLFLLDSENRAPVAEDLTLSTYRNTALTARFAATDPEGDLLTFQLVSKPARGAVTMPEEGEDTFLYTPYENKTGRDTFTYVAVDAVGNTSAPATVKLKIEKPATKVTYADLDGSATANAAIRLAEEGVFVGECMGGSYFFQPDLPVSRSQFVAMLMNTAGVEALEDVSRTGFADDGSIPQWAKPYAAAALKAGLVQGGRDTDGQAVFQADAPVTRAEASVLLDRALRVTDVAQSTFGTDLSGVPVWAAQSAANLESCGLLQAAPDGVLSLSGTLTRGEAAQLLSGALDVLEARKEPGWFPW